MNAKTDLMPVSVDPVIFSIVDNRLHVLLLKREAGPYEGMWGLPGGVMEKQDNLLENALARVLRQKTGASVNYMEQLCSRSGHDPRGPTVAVAYMALVDKQNVVGQAKWFTIEDVQGMDLAFDHKYILEYALERLSNKVNYSTLPMHFIAQPFTLPKLQKVYEILLNEKLDKSTFRKKIEETGVLEETGDIIKDGPHRPSKLYRLSEQKVHNFASNIVR